MTRAAASGRSNGRSPRSATFLSTEVAKPSPRAKAVVRSPDFISSAPSSGDMTLALDSRLHSRRHSSMRPSTPGSTQVISNVQRSSSAAAAPIICTRTYAICRSEGLAKPASTGADLSSLVTSRGGRAARRGRNLAVSANLEPGPAASRSAGGGAYRYRKHERRSSRSLRRLSTAAAVHDHLDFAHNAA